MSRWSLLICVPFLLVVNAADARPVRIWSYQQLMEEADLVIIADASAPVDTENTDGFLPSHLVQMETRLAIHAVLKCRVDDQRILKAITAREKGHELGKTLRNRMAQFDAEARELETGSIFDDPFGEKSQEDVENATIDESKKRRIAACTEMAKQQIQEALKSITDAELRKQVEESLRGRDIRSQFRILVAAVDRPALDVAIEFIHFRYKDGVTGLGNGPCLVRFRTEGPVVAHNLIPFLSPLRGPKPTYLLFLKRRNDGKYEALSGQHDPIDSIMRLEGYEWSSP